VAKPVAIHPASLLSYVINVDSLYPVHFSVGHITISVEPSSDRTKGHMRTDISDIILLSVNVAGNVERTTSHAALPGLGSPDEVVRVPAGTGHRLVDPLHTPKARNLVGLGDNIPDKVVVIGRSKFSERPNTSGEEAQPMHLAHVWRERIVASVDVFVLLS